MRHLLGHFLLASFALLGARSALAHEPLSLHPDNGHYFLFRGQPTIIVTSAEHYGAVLNRDFDYVKYLDELAAHGLNNTRTFAGAYCEDAQSFNISKNSLAPAHGKFLSPWARSDQPGYAGGGNKFDLTRWDDAYFRRLHDFLAQAGRRGIIVELNLFCPFYEDSMWKLSPQNAANNVNGIGSIGREQVYTLDKNGKLLEIQLALVRKLVRELNDYDNLYYEICNEPYFGGVTMEWQKRIVDEIVAAERDLPHRHLISMNIANGAQKIVDPHPAVSIFNFHYARPPDAVAQNFALNKVIGDNETGFKGTADDHYRREAWEFILAGGGLYNNLDYSFVVGHEDGSYQYPDKSPGGGNRNFRRQMKFLKDFIHGFNFLRMMPAQDLIVSKSPKSPRVQLLAESGRQYALYVHGQTDALQLRLPPGQYVAEWMDPIAGKSLDKQSISASQASGAPPEKLAPTTFRLPKYERELVGRITRK